MAIALMPSAAPTGRPTLDGSADTASLPVATTAWRQQMPVLTGRGVHLRELRTSDAPSLFALLTIEEVARFISPPPTTVDGFVRFIEWTHARRAEGRHACFAVVPDGTDTAVGLIQFHMLEGDGGVAEWGFALGRGYWGTGLFMESAHMVLCFAFGTVGVRRMEARAVTENGRGNSVLRKLGAVREAHLRKAFAKGLRRYDQYLWSILVEDWRQAKFTWDERLRQLH